MKIVIGSDHRGYELKEILKRRLAAAGHAVNDVGCVSSESTDYPDYAFAVARAVAIREAQRGILICSSGIGMSIAANKVRGIRAALCCNELMATRSRRHNDSNVLCLGADFISVARAGKIVNAWLGAEFESGRHLRRLRKIARADSNTETRGRVKHKDTKTQRRSPGALAGRADERRAASDGRRTEGTETRSGVRHKGTKTQRGVLGFLVSWCLGVLVFGSALLANPLENVRTDSWVYDAIDGLKTFGLIRSVPSSSRPWTRGYAAQLVAEAQTGEKGDIPPRGVPFFPAGFAGYYLARLQGEFASELADRSRSRFPRPSPLLRFPTDSHGTLDFDMFSRFRADTGNQSGSAGTVFRATTPEKFAAYSRIELTRFRDTIPNVMDSAWFRHVPGTREDRYHKNMTVDITEGYLRFQIPWFELELGRSYAYWGPGYLSSVMLGNTAPSLDKIQLTGNYQRFKYTAFTAALSAWRARLRFLSAERIEVNFLNRFVAGAAIFVAHAIGPDTSRNTDANQTKDFWAYLNPLIPLYPEMANSNHSDNLLVGADLAAYLPRVKVYGQLMVDNMQWDSIGPWETEPPLAIGIQAGLLATPLPMFDFRYEYARIYNFTYYHWIPWISYTSYGVPLGHELGPDADQHYLELMSCPCPWGQIGLLGSITRRGSHNQGDWTNRTWFPGKVLQERKFPSGTVQREISVGPKVLFEPWSWLRINAEGAWYTTHAMDDQGGVGERLGSGPSFSARVEFRCW
jgi:ribose 5-phosphate isomerase B